MQASVRVSVIQVNDRRSSDTSRRPTCQSQGDDHGRREVDSLARADFTIKALTWGVSVIVPGESPVIVVMVAVVGQSLDDRG